MLKLSELVKIFADNTATFPDGDTSHDITVKGLTFHYHSDLGVVSVPEALKHDGCKCFGLGDYNAVKLLEGKLSAQIPFGRPVNCRCRISLKVDPVKEYDQAIKRSHPSYFGEEITASELLSAEPLHDAAGNLIGLGVGYRVNKPETHEKPFNEILDELTKLSKGK